MGDGRQPPDEHVIVAIRGARRRRAERHAFHAGERASADGCVALAKQGRLMAYPHRGYWKPTDTVKERIALDEAYSRGERPWALWERE